jgi:hypothetical protein
MQSFTAYTTHFLPLLGDLPVSTLLRIRKEERDSFARYRLAITRLLKSVVEKKKRIGKREVQDLFKDQIEPELLRMKSELRQEQGRQTKRIAGGLAALGASVGLGAFGMLPLAAASAAVAAPLLGSAAKSTCEHGSYLKEKNDFYFLLRLVQEN